MLCNTDKTLLGGGRGGGVCGRSGGMVFKEMLRLLKILVRMGVVEEGG